MTIHDHQPTPARSTTHRVDPAGAPPEGLLDALVVGGGAAGLSAALVLARSRRRVLVVDAGDPRNAPAAGVHAFLSRDGMPPGELLAHGRTEVERYGGEVRAGRVTSASRVGGRFRVHLDDGPVVTARRLVVTTGLVDELPDVEGLAERWGRDVVHCPYCHGWEVRDRTIGVLATSPDVALHQAGLFRQLTDHVVVLSHTTTGFDRDALARLRAHGVEVVDGEVAALHVADDALVGVRLVDGRTVELEALAVAPTFAARSSMLADLGLEVVPHPSGMGVHVPTDEVGRTAVDGVVAAGNVTDPFAQVMAAAAAGNMAGAMVNADLVQEDLAAPSGSMDRATASPDHEPEDQQEWDAIYAERGSSPMWSGRPNGTLVVEVDDLAPGSVLDVGAGEGGDAIWLARRGWEVTAVEPSSVALDRARSAAAREDVDVSWQHAGLLDLSSDRGPFDLVSAQYPALRTTDDGAAITALLDAVAPGGTLLFVHHRVGEHGFRTGDHDAHDDVDGADGARGGPRHDPDDYVMPHDVAAHLARHVDRGDWVVEVHEVRPRAGELPPEARHVEDIVLRARRRAG